MHEDRAALQAGGAVQTEAQPAAPGDETSPVLLPFRRRLHGPLGDRLPPPDVSEPGPRGNRESGEQRQASPGYDQRHKALHRYDDRFPRTREIQRELQPLFFFQAEDGIRDLTVTGVQTCALPISIQYMRKNLGPYWRRNGWEAADLLKAAARDYGSLQQIGRASGRERV